MQTNFCQFGYLFISFYNMLKSFFLATSLAIALSSQAMVTFTADSFNSSSRTCRLTALSNHDEVTGTFSLPDTYNYNGTIYSITAIASNAVNDLPNVETLVIPASIVQIGDCKATDLNGVVNNFQRCPKLKAFKVASGNTVFSTTDEGILMAQSVLQRCPEAVVVTSRQLTLPKTVYRIVKDAFTDVSTVTKLSIPSRVFVSQNGGLNNMKWLSDITVYSEGPASLRAENGVLFGPLNAIYCFPPMKMQGTYTIPNDITVIGSYAFANCLYLSELNTNKVEDIYSDAFRNSNVKTLYLYKVEGVGVRAFASMKALTLLRFLSHVNIIPEGMAQDCPKLEKVEYVDGLPSEIQKSAFKNCPLLTSHPFSAEFLFGDSAFYNTGFSEVIFKESKPAFPGRVYGTLAFGDCKNLTKIDMSAIDCTDNYYSTECNMAGGSTNLKEVLFAPRTHFNQSLTNDRGSYSAMGADIALDKIQLGAFTAGQYKEFNYNGPGTFKPNVYVKTNGMTGTANIGSMWSESNGAVVNPIFYHEAFAPLSPSFYVKKGASYYIPGGARDNFARAIEDGCYVEEFYRLTTSVVDGGLVINFKVLFPDMVNIKSICVNYNTWNNQQQGTIVTAIPPSMITRFEVNYTVNGVDFTTTYPAEFYAGVDDIEIDHEQVEPEYFNLLGVKVKTPQAGNVYVVRRGDKVTKEVF